MLVRPKASVLVVDFVKIFNEEILYTPIYNSVVKIIQKKSYGFLLNNIIYLRKYICKYKLR